MKKLLISRSNLPLEAAAIASSPAATEDCVSGTGAGSGGGAPADQPDQASGDPTADAISQSRKELSTPVLSSLWNFGKAAVLGAGSAVEAGANALPGLAKGLAKPFTRTAATIVGGAEALGGNAPTEEDTANLKGTMFEPYGTKREAVGGALQIGATLLPGSAEAKALAAGTTLGAAVKGGAAVGAGTGATYGAGAGRIGAPSSAA